MKTVIKLREPDSTWNKYTKKLSDFTDVFFVYDINTNEVFEDTELMLTTKITEQELLSFPSLKRIFLFKTGIDQLPIDELSHRKISVVPSHANSDAIAEHALSLALSLLHRTIEFHEDLKHGIWYSDGKNFKWRSISDLTIGILGFGHIGKAIYEKVYPLNKNICVLNQSLVYPKEIHGVNSLNELIENSDLIFISLPKSNSTINMIDEKVLSKMHGKYIVNVGRSEICNQKSLYDALDFLGGYAGDVWYNAPNKKDKLKPCMPAEYPFHEHKNVVMSPHCATHEINAHERYISDAVNSCVEYIKSSTI